MATQTIALTSKTTFTITYTVSKYSGDKDRLNVTSIVMTNSKTNGLSNKCSYIIGIGFSNNSLTTAQLTDSQAYHAFSNSSIAIYDRTYNQLGENIISYGFSADAGTKTKTVSESKSIYLPLGHISSSYPYLTFIVYCRTSEDKEYCRVTSVSGTFSAKTSYQITFNGNGTSTNVPAAQTKWYNESLTLTSSTPSRSGYSFKCWNTNTSDSGTRYNSGGTVAAGTNSALTLYAIWNPIISYNANNGSGAPSSQTKTFNAALVLSSTKPTRSGYSFKCWNTNTSDSGTRYASGGTVVANMNTATTLYAIWNPTITYNANGGNGAPTAQTKIFNNALTLSTGRPTRNGYTFLGWSKSSSASTASYQPGGTLEASTNGATTLYAVWKVNNPSLQLSSLRVADTESDGYSRTAPTEVDEGTKACVKITSVPSVATSISSLEVTLTIGSYVWSSTDAGYSLTDMLPSTNSPIVYCIVSKTTGWSSTNNSTVVTPVNADIDASYSGTVTVTDQAGNSVTSPFTLEQAFFIMDFANGGHSIGIGGPAPSDSVLEVNMPFRIKLESNTNSSKMLAIKGLSIKASDDSAPSSTIYHPAFSIIDRAGIERSYFKHVESSTGYQGLQIETRRVIGGSNVYHGIQINISDNGSRNVSVSDRRAWSDELLATSEVCMYHSTTKGDTNNYHRFASNSIDQYSSKSVANTVSSNTFVTGYSDYDSNGSNIGYSQIVNGGSQLLYRSFAVTNPRSTGTNKTTALYLQSYDNGTRKIIFNAPLDMESNSATRYSTTVTANDCTIASNACYRNGSVVTITMSGVKLSAALANGNSRQIATVPAGYRPTMNVYTLCVATNTTIQGKIECKENANGVVTIINRSGASIATTDGLYITFTYVQA